MKSKYLLLVGLLPLFYSCANKTNVTTQMNYQNQPMVDNEESDDSDSCTVLYVGKNVSKNKKAIIARTSDAGPGAMMINTTIFPHNSLANQTITSNKGFTYKMPSTTYKYISTPRNPVINKGHHWEASAINENGVGVSATLSCYTKNEILAENVDPLVPTGIGEDNIAQIVGATATTAREGMEIIANIIEDQGSVETNAIMTIDQNEAWYMEIYSGHQYVAVKCPDNMILTAGNEFVFDSIEKMSSEMGIKESDMILSGKLLETVPEDLRKPTGVEDVRKLELANSYADFSHGDLCHTRTWRGYNMFAKNNYPQWEKYDVNQKYDAFYKPDNKDLDIHDVTRYMRDRYEDILEISGPNTQRFKELEAEHNLRYIGIENAYQVHAIQSDKELPKDLAATEWLSISNSNYTPFVPINCSIRHMSDYYTRVSDTYSYDEKSAANIFKKLNTLARNDREFYGRPIENFWITYENIWEQQYNDLINQVKDLDTNSRSEIMTNYITQIQNDAVKTALFMIDDLTWHMMNDSFDFGSPTRYRPCVNVKEYATKYGYSYSKNNKTVTIKKGQEQYTLVQTREDYRPGDTKNIYRPEGEVRYGDNIDKIEMVIKDDEVYIPHETLVKYVKGDLIINMNDYRDPFNHAVWIIPVSIGVPLIGVVIFFVLKNARKQKTI
ncbi:MAG: C69 family dipeptidase [Bacilli bacterium]|nr:C69 family dipeptidase [Bacilli bacterium]